jgi:hypothetical protein
VAVREEALRIESRYREDLRQVAETAGAELFGARVKAAEALGEKFQRKGSNAETLGDYLGGRIWFNEYGQDQAIIDQLTDRGYKVVEGEDESFLFDPVSRDGYRARHVQLLDVDGNMVVELQLVPREIGEVQEFYHKFLELRRTNLAEPELEFFLDQMREGYGEAHSKWVERNLANEQIHSAGIAFQQAYPSLSKYDTGEVVVTGPMHFHATMDIQQAYPEVKLEDAVDGFVTTAGRFLTREEAEQNFGIR